MGIRRLARLAFDIMAWGTMLTLFCLLVLGIGAAVLGNDAEVVRIATPPAAARNDTQVSEITEVTEVTEVTEITEVTEVTEEESEVTAAESEVVMLSYVVAEKDDTAQSEALYDVPLDADLQRFMIEKANEIGIDPAVLFAMARKESTYDPGAIGDNGDSLGLMQIQPKWNMERMVRLGCTDLFDPYQNVTVAVDLMGELMSRYGDVSVALTVYNWGHWPGYVTEYAQTVMQYAEEVNHE